MTAQRPPSIALVEDETVLRDELCFQLRHLGFAAEGFEDASQLYRRLAVHRFSAIVLDIGLNGEDGLSICQYLRAHDRALGIVFVTARALRDDRLIGLHAGADAYLCKPVDLDELALTLNRLTTRNAVELAPEATAEKRQEFDEWQIESPGDFLRAPGGKRVHLTVNEIRLLTVLLSKPNEVAVAGDLAAALGMLPEDYDKHRVEVIISRLRDKVLRQTGLTLPVQTRRGVGYLFRPG